MVNFDAELEKKLDEYQKSGKIKFGPVKEIPNISGDEIIDYIYECEENRFHFFRGAVIAMKNAGVLSDRQFKKIYKKVKAFARENGVIFTDPF